MFKKLRNKFIAITMAMVAIVMAFSFTVVCAVEYQRSCSVVQTALEGAVDEAIALSNRSKERPWVMRPESRQGTSSSAAQDEGGSGDMPDANPASNARNDGDAAQPSGNPQEGQRGLEPGFQRRAARGAGQAGGAGEAQQGLAQQANGSEDDPGALQPAAASSSSDDGGENPDSAAVSDEDTSQPAPPSIGIRPGQQRAMSSIVPIAVYKIGSDGATKVIPEVTTATISSDVLQDAAETATQSQDGFGTFADLGLHYYKAEDDGTTYLAFADTSYTDGWKSLALILTGSGIGTLAAFFVVALFYSRWALRPVKEAWDSQRQFVADASHDLKTPLTVILANAAILLKHPDHTIASESQWVESTQREAEEMQGLVNEMLELAQIEAGQQAEATREPIDLSDLVDGETLLFDSVALERNCSFNCSIDEGITMLGDEKQVKKLVSTLVENAFKYVDESGTVDVTLRRSGKSAAIGIRNTGSTISPEDLPHIFDRFYRTDKARTSGTGGFGLGLAIAREIARNHGGDITCKSTDAEGTTFTITLPIAQ